MLGAARIPVIELRFGARSTRAARDFHVSFGALAGRGCGVRVDRTFVDSGAVVPAW